jgi:isopenicillin-N epimerase
MIDLSPGISYFNHATLGLCPSEVLLQVNSLLAEIERNPIAFFDRGLLEMIDRVIDRVVGELASFINAASEDLILIENATHAANVIVNSLEVPKAGKLLVTSHEYGAFWRLFKKLEQQWNAQVEVVKIPIDCTSPDIILQSVVQKMDTATHAVFFSHVSYLNGAIFPASQICSEANKRGILSVVDGSQAVGNVGVDIRSIQPSYYFASTHKWLFTARPTGFIYSAKSVQSMLKPLIFSWGSSSPQVYGDYRDEFVWLGTRDFSKLYTLVAGIDFHKRYLSGSSFIECRLRLARLLEAINKLRQTGSLYCSADSHGLMASALLGSSDVLKVMQTLSEQKIEAKVGNHNGQAYIRLCMLPYVSELDVSRLLRVLAV